MQAQFIRASFLPYLAGVGREKARQLVVAGFFGPRFQPRDRQRETLLRLADVRVVLGLDDAAVTEATVRYLAGHKLDRPPVVTRPANSMRRVRP